MIEKHPEIIALLMVAIGFLLAHLSSKWCRYGLAAMKKATERLSVSEGGKLSLFINSEVISRIVYYLVLGFFFLLALQAIGSDIISSWLDNFISYIPRLLVGLCIIFAGILLGQLAKSLVQNILPEAANKLLPRLSQYLVVIAAVVTGLGQMAIEISFLSTLILMITAALLGSISLAFALGSKKLVANLLARREIEIFKIGDELEVESVCGKVVDMTRTGIILESDRGMIHIPAEKLTTSVVVQRHADVS